MSTKKISLSQNKIVFSFILIVSVFLMLWLYLYLPSERELVGLKSRFVAVDNQIQQIENALGKSQTRGENIKLLKEKYKQLNNRFPQKEEEGLRIIMDSARKMNMEIVSIRPQLKTALLDEDNRKIEIEGKTCHKVSVFVSMRGSYEHLIEYIENLEDSLPVFVNIERLKINKDNSSIVNLNINLELNLYLLF